MTSEHHHDPVSAVSEAEATGRTAEIFAEIREIMQIPIVTSIWRTLDAIEGGLEAAWEATRPIYQSGQPDALLRRFGIEVELPIPEPPSDHRLRSLGINNADRKSILSIIEAYNRSNGLNLIALTALVRGGSSRQLQATARLTVPWPGLPPLLSKDEIDSDNWALLQRMKHLGNIHPTDALPTLWRHLIHWPGLLELTLDIYGPLHRDGTLFQMVECTTAFVESQAPAMSRFRNSSIEIPEEAMDMVDAYVGKPPSVSRMFSLGSSVAKWLQSNGWTH